MRGETMLIWWEAEQQTAGNGGTGYSKIDKAYCSDPFTLT